MNGRDLQRSRLELRPYQREAVEAIIADLGTSNRVLLQAATGAGKTIIFCEVIKRFLNANPGMNVVVMAHRQELVTQARDKLIAVWPASFGRIGIACAGIGAVDTSAQVVIGSVQTIARRDWRGKHVGLLIVDEAHHIPPAGANSQYNKVISKLTAANPALKCIGVTATPYRLDSGFIFGRNLFGWMNFFDKLNWQIGMDDLIHGGFLAPYRAKEPVSVDDELRRIGTVAGEYNTKQLSNLMGNAVHIGTAVKAYDKYGEGRQHVLVFGVTVEHASRLAEAFAKAGHEANVIHARLPRAKRAELLRAFAGGSLKVLCNVGVLTEGWDCPKADLVLLCRPTLSTALYVQMVGRGMRISHGKRDVLILDLANNFRRHGHPDAPYITTQDFHDAKDCIGIRVCPNCREIVGTGLGACPCCGHEFKEGRKRLKEAWVLGGMKEVGAPSPDGMTRLPRPMAVPLPEVAAIPGVAEPDPDAAPWTLAVRGYTATAGVSRAGRIMLVVNARLEDGNGLSKWLDIEGAAGNGHARSKAVKFWRNYSGDGAPPQSVDEALKRVGELRLPARLTVAENTNGYAVAEEFED